MSAQILVVKPQTLNKEDKALLRKSSVVCIEASDPSSVRLLSAEGPALGGDDLFYAAMQAIASDKYTGNTAEVFAKQVAVLAKASRGISEKSA
jgi:hypothetical protein